MIDERKLLEDVQSLDKSYFYLPNLFENLIQRQEKIMEWIPCSERLPEKNGMYFITLKDLDFNGECHCFTEFRYYSSRKKKWDEGIERDNPGMEIIAWMPLPEPYEGD